MALSKFESLILYYTVFFVSIFIFSFYRNKKSYIANIVIILSALFPSILSGLRYNVGSDYFNYDSLITYLKEVSWEQTIFPSSSSYEIGFRVLVKFLSSFGTNGFVFCCITFLTLIVFQYALIKNFPSHNNVIIYCIYLFCFFPTSFNAMRQLLAASFVFAASQYIFKKDIKKFFLLSLIATSIHLSSFIIIPMYFLWNKKKETLKKKYAVLILIVVTILAISYTLLLPQLATIFPFFSKYLYLSMLNTSTNRDIYVKILALILLLIFRKKLNYNDKRSSFYIVLYAIAVIIGFTGFRTPYLKRLTIYFSIAATTLFGSIPTTFNSHRVTSVFDLLSIILSVSYFTLVFYVIGDNNIFPYIFR